MNRLFAIFILMCAFVFAAGASTALPQFADLDTCVIKAEEGVADKKDGKKGDKKEGEEEAEPECD